jgi:hypothetical protein
MDAKALEKYIKLLALAEHPDTPANEAKTALKAARRLEEKHPNLQAAAAAFHAQEEARRTAEVPPDFRDPEVFREVWATLAEELEAAAEGAGDGLFGQAKSKLLRWFKDRGAQMVEEQAEVLLQVLEEELAATSAADPDVTVELSGLVEIEGDDGEDYDVAEVSLELSAAALRDPEALGRFIVSELVDQLQEEGWEEFLEG